jgi:hypothetical protein
MSQTHPASKNPQKQTAIITHIANSKNENHPLSFIVLVAVAKTSNGRLHKRHIDALIDRYYKSIEENSETKQTATFSYKLLTKNAPLDIFQLSNKISKYIILTDWSKLGLEISEPEALIKARRIVTKRLLDQVYSHSMNDISDLTQASALRLIKITLENRPLDAHGLLREVFGTRSLLAEELKPYVADYLAVFSGAILEERLKRVKLEKLPAMGFQVKEAPNYMILWCSTALSRISAEQPSESNSLNNANLNVMQSLAYEVKGLVFRAIECRKKAVEYYQHIEGNPKYQEDIEQNTHALKLLCDIAEQVKESADEGKSVKPKQDQIDHEKAWKIMDQILGAADKNLEKNIESIKQLIAKYSYSLADEFTHAALKYESDVNASFKELLELMQELDPNALDDNPVLEKLCSHHLKPEKLFFGKIQEILRRLIVQEPKFKLFMAYVSRELGDIYQERRQFAEGASAYKAAFDLFLELSEVDVTVRVEAIKTLARLKKNGVSSQATAVECFRKSVPLLNELAEVNGCYKIMCLWYQMRIADYYSSEKSVSAIIYRKKTLRLLRELASAEGTPDQIIAIHRPEYSFKENLILTLVELAEKCVTPKEKLMFYTEALVEYQKTFCSKPPTAFTKIKRWSREDLDLVSRIIASLGTEYAKLGGEKNVEIAKQLFDELELLIEQRSQLLLIEENQIDQKQFELIIKKMDLYYLINLSDNSNV